MSKFSSNLERATRGFFKNPNKIEKEINYCLNKREQVKQNFIIDKIVI